MSKGCRENKSKKEEEVDTSKPHSSWTSVSVPDSILQGPQTPTSRCFPGRVSPATLDPRPSALDWG